MKKPENISIGLSTSKTYKFIVIYGLMIVLWLLGFLMEYMTPAKRIDSLNTFECPSDNKIRNQYDCSRFDLEKNSDYAFYFEAELTIFDPTIYMRIYRQTGLKFNEDRVETIYATLYKIYLDSNGKISHNETYPQTKYVFNCLANEYTCGPKEILPGSVYPRGKHYFVYRFENNQELFKTIKHVEIYMEHFDQAYQNLVIFGKLSMLVLMIIGTSLYYKRLRRNNTDTWSSEQIWTLFLSALTICLNDPFILLSHGLGLTFLTFLSKISVTIGLSLILPFWIATFRNLRQKTQSRFILYQELIFACVNLSVIAVCTLFVPYKPSFFFWVFKMLNVIGGSWILYHLVRDLLTIRSFVWVDKLFLFFSTYFAAAYFGLVYQWNTPIDVSSINYNKELTLIFLFTIYTLISQYLMADSVRTDYVQLDKKTPTKKQYSELEDEM